MGVCRTISYDKFPQQHAATGTITDAGLIARRDLEFPHREIVVKGAPELGQVYINGMPPTTKQGQYLGKRCNVCFEYQSRLIRGSIVRDDYEAAADGEWYTVIRLDDGRYVTAGECQYQPSDKEPVEGRGESAGVVILSL